MGIKEFDKWAKFYDLIYEKRKDDIEFYKNEAKKAEGRVLEVACGTGRIYLELLKEGVDIYGIDISEEMLKVLNKKAKELRLTPRVDKADMMSFRLGYGFSLIIAPFRSFLHNLTSEDQLKTLQNLREHLLPEGKLILNFFFPSPEMIFKTYGKEIRETIKTKEGKFKLIRKSYFIDEPNQIIEFTETLVRNNKLIWKDKFQIALIYKKEFELLLRLAGFERWEVFGSFNYKPLKSNKQEMVWIIER